MADTGTTLLRQHLAAPPSPPPNRRRPLLARFSMAHAVMVLSGLLTFVLIAAVLGNRPSRIQVAVARVDIGAGTVVTPAMAEAQPLASDSTLAPRFATLDHLRDGRWVATRAIAAGDPMSRSELSRDDPANGLRSMSIPVARENAVGGAVAVGDRVDVIDVVDGRALFVVANAQVVKVSSPDTSGGITRDVSRGFFVVVQVNAGEALAIAQALADGKVDLVRSPSVPATVLSTAAPTAPVAQPASTTGVRR